MWKSWKSQIPVPINNIYWNTVKFSRKKLLKIILNWDFITMPGYKFNIYKINNLLYEKQKLRRY